MLKSLSCSLNLFLEVKCLQECEMFLVCFVVKIWKKRITYMANN